jgi:hypothetical protein
VSAKVENNTPADESTNIARRACPRTGNRPSRCPRRTRLDH